MSKKKGTTLSLPFGSTDDEGGSTVSPEREPITVAALVAEIGATLDAEFADVLVAGELSSYKLASSGHCYFTLSDSRASIDAAMWRSDVRKQKHKFEVGDEVVCRGRIGVYDRQGRMQLYATRLDPVGLGAAQRALEELKKRLHGEGLFDSDRKAALPFLPRTVGIVTSATGAAFRDILTTLERRFAHLAVVLSPAIVQGKEAPTSIIRAIDLLEADGRADVIIVGRGGGASEDLAVFNDERVVRRVAGCRIPTVSAVGHEVDTTLCDLVADYRAATPTAAAEAVVPVYAELLDDVLDSRMRLAKAIRGRVQFERHRLGNTAGRLRHPNVLLAQTRQRLDEAGMRLERALVADEKRARRRFERSRDSLITFARSWTEKRSTEVRALDRRARRAISRTYLDRATSFAELRSKLDALSPLAVLERGYSLVARDDGKLVRRAADLSPDDPLKVRFQKGRALVRVVSTDSGD